MRSARIAGTTALVIAAALVLAPSALAHARVSPAVSLSGELQLYSLAIPTEKEGLTTNKIVMTVPKGFSIDSFVPSPGWTRSLQQTGSGDSAVVQKVTWSGGSTPTEDDSLFQFLGQPAQPGHVHLPGAADVLRRLDRRLVGLRVVRGAGADHQGGLLDRRQQRRHAGHRRGGAGGAALIIAVVGLFLRGGGGGGGRELA